MGLFSKNYIGTLQWEAIKCEGESGHPYVLYRATVPGGWLVQSPGGSGGLAFVPDPEHRWDLR